MRLQGHSQLVADRFTLGTCHRELSNGTQVTIFPSSHDAVFAMIYRRARCAATKNKFDAK